MIYDSKKCLPIKIALAACVALMSWAFPCVGMDPGDAECPEKFSADRIAKRVQGVYSNCKSYLDIGDLTVIYTEQGAYRRIHRAQFETAFVRPDKFRFEFTKDVQYLIHRNATDVKAWLEYRGEIRSGQSLASELGAAAGITYGVSLDIPPMLDPANLGQSMFDRTLNLRRIDDEVHDGRLCYCITGDFRSSTITWWVDNETFEVRKIRSMKSRLGLVIEQIVVYESHLNVEVPQELLKFNPK